jgi:hypothetical protein
MGIEFSFAPEWMPLMSIPPVSTNSTITTILPKLSDADQKKFDTVKANLQSALDTLKNSSKTSGNLTAQANAQRKAMAEQEIAQIKQAIKSLQQFHGLDPKATARMVAQLAKQLAQAVKDYAAAGGSDASVTASAPVSTGATPSAAPEADSSDVSASAAPASTDNTAAPAQTGGIAATSSTPNTPQGTATNAYAQTQQIAVTTGNSDDAQDKAFTDDVNQIKNALRNFVTQLRHSIKSRFMPESVDPDMKDVRAADDALDDVDRSLSKITK